ncbi:MAG TPA: ABC transporter substrate-binding protein [Anaerolineales bacterium]|jgi:iron complex transport system substrate-binding protein|nr:ABC transporter substrate-binding protein [Anaerolineales bacterium]
MLRKILVLTLLAALLFGCAPAVTPQAAPTVQPTQPAQVQPEPTAITLTDGLGRQVKLDHPAQRVVSLAPSNTEILFAIGAGSQVIGRDELSNYPEQAKGLQSVGGSMGNFSTEAIVALKPDLVLAAEINPTDLVKSLEDLGLTVYYLKNPTTLEEMYSNLETVAQLTGHESDAQTLIQSLKSRVAAVDAKLTNVTEKPTVFYELDASDPTKPYTVGPGTFIDQLIQRAGGVNVASTLKDSYPQISLEEVVALNPSIIILGDSAYGALPESVKSRAGWNVIDAVKKGNIYPFNDDLVSRPGPRLVDALEELAKLLHPDLFK